MLIQPHCSRVKHTKKEISQGECGKSCLFAFGISLGFCLSFFFDLSFLACAFNSVLECKRADIPAEFRLPQEVRTFVLHLLLCNMVLPESSDEVKGEKNCLPMRL